MLDKLELRKGLNVWSKSDWENNKSNSLSLNEFQVVTEDGLVGRVSE